MKEVRVKRGHYGFDLRVTVYDGGELFDLSSYTVVLKVWEPETQTLKWTLTGTVIDTGIVDCAVTSSDFDEAGSYFAELEWTAAGVVDGSETFHIIVEPSV